MSRIRLPLAIAVIASMMASGVAGSEETGRIKRKPPDAAEAERIASETVMNDNLLQKGDIVVTDRGFLVFQGLAPDGITNEFLPLLNPVTSNKARRRTP